LFSAAIKLGTDPARGIGGVRGHRSKVGTYFHIAGHSHPRLPTFISPTPLLRVRGFE
jgi:hypothetical protein